MGLYLRCIYILHHWFAIIEFGREVGPAERKWFGCRWILSRVIIRAIVWRDAFRCIQQKTGAEFRSSSRSEEVNFIVIQSSERTRGRPGNLTVCKVITLSSICWQSVIQLTVVMMIHISRAKEAIMLMICRKWSLIYLVLF